MIYSVVMGAVLTTDVPDTGDSYLVGRNIMVVYYY